VTAGDTGGIVMMIGRVLLLEIPFPDGSGAKTRGSSHHPRVHATGRRDESSICRREEIKEQV
jgi:hypothetical protein